MFYSHSFCTVFFFFFAQYTRGLCKTGVLLQWFKNIFLKFGKL